MKVKVITKILFIFLLAFALVTYKLPIPFCVASEISPISTDSVSSSGEGETTGYEGVQLYVIGINNDNNTEKADGYPNPLPLPNPCSDVRFRHALWHLMNRSYVTSAIWNGVTVPQYTVVPQPEYKHTEIKPNRLLSDLTHPYNFEEANAILDEAGYTDKDEDTWRDNPDGSSITLIFYAREDDPERVQLAEWYTSQLNAAHINVDLRIEPENICYDAVMINKTHHLYTGGWNFGFEQDPITQAWMSDQYWHPGFCSNYNRVNCIEFDEASTLFSHTKSVDDGYEVQEIFNNESYLGALGIIPVAARVIGTERVHNVDTGLNYTTIQEAIDAPETLGGHTISVDAGTYCENVVIDKALTLTGEDRSNTIINSTGFSYPGALVKIESDNVRMSGFTVTAAAHQGIDVADSQYCEVHDNIVCFTGDRGIVFGGGGSNNAYNNVVHNSSAYGGIEAVWSSNNSIYNNLAYFNQWGIATNHGSYNRIYNNTVHSNRGIGIHIDWPSTDNILYNNNVGSNTNVGISVINQANRTEIFGNKISESYFGIRLENSFANNISGNYIIDNAYGVMLDLSENNTIYHNNFIDNAWQVHIQPSRFNIWDHGYPSGGNYWSDYTGLDLRSGPYQNEVDSDGIGDVPYTIDANNTDRYPLMRAHCYEDRMTQLVSTESAANSFRASLSVDSSGNIHIAWQDDTDYAGSGADTDIFYKKFEVCSGWTPTEVVSTESTGNSEYPSLGVDFHGNVHIAWQDWTDYGGSGSDADIFYKRYEVGVGWTATEVVSTGTAWISCDPSLTVDLAGNVHIVWDDFTPYGGSGSDADIFYRRYEVGSGWTTTEVVSTESTGDSYDPSLSVDSSGNVHVAWWDYTDYGGSGTDVDIFYKRYEVGSGWTTTEVVSTESTGNSFYPSLDLDSSRNIHVAWQDYTDYVGHGLDADIFYKRYEVGVGWTATEVVSTESKAHSRYPSLTVDLARNVHIAWEDATDYGGSGTDADIFYKYIRVHSTQYPWPMFRHNIRHKGYTESPAPNTNEPMWNYTTGSVVDSSPAVVDGKVYVGSCDNKVYCLDAMTGAHIWNYTTENDVDSSPAVANGRVYVGSCDGNVYCLDAITGTHIWNYTTGGPVRSSPAITYGNVYVGSSDGKVYCLDAMTGAHIWNYTTGSYVSSSPAVVDGKVYVGSCDNKVYCLDAATGTHVWNYTIEGDVDSSPAVAGGKVYVGSGFLEGIGKIYCLDAAIGIHIWNYTTGSYVCSSPAVADGKVYVGSDDGKVYCLNAQSGADIWNYTTGDCVRSSPAIADGIVFVGSHDHTVYAFGNIIRVPDDYPTVQEAIDAADSGAKILVAPGIYREHLVVDELVDIEGKEGSAPIFEGGGTGIAVSLLSGASGSTIAGIVITNYEQGILIADSSDCEICGNVMTHMEYSAVAIDGAGAVNNHVYSNIIQDNAVAIDLTESTTSSTIYKNIISLNGVGLKLESSGNVIYANTISGNDVGIDASNSNNNVIYHNNLVDNVVQVVIATSVNTWDNGYPDGGNYWSTFTGDDIHSGPGQDKPGNDGVIDTQYIIAVSNVDEYPLAGPFNPHDVGIGNLFTSKTVIAEGRILFIDLRILNYGAHDEAFTITIYANTTVIATYAISLTKRNATTVTLEWDTTSYARGKYSISAYITTVPDETDTTDNTLVSDECVCVTIPGDVDCDRDVDLYDAVKLLKCYGAKEGSPNYDANCDIDGDGDIDLYDAVALLTHYGQKDQ